MKIRIALLLGCLCSGTASFCAGIGSWRSFTSMNEVRDVVRVEDRYWAATGGGLFLLEPATNQFVTYTNAEGLISNDLTATIADGRGNIWTGASDGLMHVLLQDGTWT